MKQKKIWQLALADILAAAVCLLVFAYFDHVRPQPMQETQVYVRATPVPAQPSGAAQTEEQQTEKAQTAEEPAETVQEEGHFSFPGVFTDGEVIVTDTSYKSRDISITLTHVTQSSPSKQSYFIEDIYISSIDCLRTVFAKDTYGRAISEDFMKLSTRVNALASINTDFYGWGSRTGGLVIRNGVLYREEPAIGEDMLVIYRDGSMETILAGTEFDAKALIDAGAWQAFSFGPALLDGNGNVNPKLEKTNHDPRTVIGMIEPGHYVLIVFDGRRDATYAKGYTFLTSAQVCIELGCKVAFNLDGGESSQMSFNGSLANNPYKGGRSVSDILYIAEPVQEATYAE